MGKKSSKMRKMKKHERMRKIVFMQARLPSLLEALQSCKCNKTILLAQDTSEIVNTHVSSWFARGTVPNSEAVDTIEAVVAGLERTAETTHNIATGGCLRQQ